VNDEDNAQYTCVAINNGGRVISNAELYVTERGKLNWFFHCASGIERKKKTTTTILTSSLFFLSQIVNSFGGDLKKKSLN
jgi:hypothetical protein